MNRRVIGDLGGVGSGQGRSGAEQAGDCAVFGNKFGKMWDLEKLGGWSGWGKSLGRCRSARLLPSEGAPKKPA